MAVTITQRIIKGRKYYYAVECQRVNGKPRLTFQKYIGTGEEIAKKFLKPEQVQPVAIKQIHFGAICALYSIAQRLRIEEIIDRIVRKRNQGLSIGQYMLLAAINRGVYPRSKNKMRSWYKKTILTKLIPTTSKDLTSQRFWDNMDRLTHEHIDNIEKELSQTLIKDFNIDLNCLIYDTTNFFTYIDTFNSRNTIAQRGHNKQKRTDLRQVNLALLVTKDFHIPLFHNTYDGNINDKTKFGSVIQKLINRYKILSMNIEQLTIVYDKGNNSEENQNGIYNSKYHFVGSLVPAYHKELLKIPLEKYDTLDKEFEGLKVYRTQKEIFGKEQTIVITYSKNFFIKQYSTVSLQMKKRIQRINALKSELEEAKRTTLDSINNKVKKILSGQHMKKLIKVKVFKRGNRIHINCRIDRKTLGKLKNTQFGKTILFTDNHSWSNKEIVAAYRGQYKIEDAFKQMKNPYFVSWYPMFHWTDQKIMVHAFYCVLALTLTSLLQRELAQKNIHMSLDSIMESLNEIKECILLYPNFKDQKVTVEGKATLTELDDTQKILYQALNLDRFRSN